MNLSKYFYISTLKRQSNFKILSSKKTKFYFVNYKSLSDNEKERQRKRDEFL